MANVKGNIRNTKRVPAIVAALAVIAIAVAATLVYTSTVSAGGDRPFKGSASGTFTGPDSGEGVINANYIGTGTVVFSDLAVDQSAGAPDDHGHFCFPTTGGDQTFTAANGDQIDTVYRSGPFCVDPASGAPVHGSFVTEITGGTGRFEDASGFINIEAVSNAPGTWSSVFIEGSYINY